MDGEEVEGHHGGQRQQQNELMKGCIKDHKGRMVAYFDPDHVLFALKLSGPPIGPITRESVLKASPESLPISIFAQWASDELDKWSLKREMQNLLADRPVHGDNSDDDEDDATSATLDTSDDEEADPDFVMGNGNSNVGSGPGPGTRQKQHPSDERYTKEEKQFLKRNWKSEWKFLQLYGLDMEDDKARDLGRDILRRMMEKDNEATKKKNNTRLGGFAARATGPRRQAPGARKVIKRSGPRAQRINAHGFLTATLGNYRVTRAPRVPQRRLGGNGSGRLAVVKEERT